MINYPGGIRGIYVLILAAFLGGCEGCSDSASNKTTNETAKADSETPSESAVLDNDAITAQPEPNRRRGCICQCVHESEDGRLVGLCKHFTKEPTLEGGTEFVCDPVFYYQVDHDCADLQEESHPESSCRGSDPQSRVGGIAGSLETCREG